jgi:hypothetical protein
MRRFWFGGAFIILACLAGPLPVHAQAVIEERVKDLGSAPTGTILTHHFRLVNQHKQPLHIGGLRVSCGVCTTATVGKYDLAPGEWTQVTVTVDTSKFSGHKTFHVYVVIDRPVFEEVRIDISAISRGDLMLAPPQLNFGTVKFGSGPTAETIIDYRGSLAGWQVTGVANDNGYLLPKVAPSGQHPGSFRLSVKLREDAPAGSWHAELYVLTNDPTAPRIRIPVTVEILPALTASPATVNVGQIAKGSLVERRITVRSGQPFKITKVEGGDAQLKVAELPSEAKTVHVLKITFSPDAVGELSRKLKIITDLPKDNMVEIAILGQAH